MRLRTSEIAEATGGRLSVPTWRSPAWASTAVTWLAGALFVPIEGERDGHDFVADALAEGAVPTSPAGSGGHRPDRRPASR